ncbi:MAG: N-acetylmuramoyl-L-alanine amidase [bacterium]
MKIKLVIILFMFFTVPFFVNGQNVAVKPIKILIVPGHDDQSPGAQYGNIRETDMTLSLANEIYSILKKDKRFDVHITRNWQGYTKEFSNYFLNQKESILAFREKAKEITKEKILNGSFVKKTNVSHVSASNNVSLKLYGINKWVDDNQIDLVLHIHFNDYPRKNKWEIGKYKGIAIYVPEKQMVNAEGSKNIANKIFEQLTKKYLVSNLKEESSGVIEDQNLIAIGARGTIISSVRSVLIEYGYIYGKIFRNTTTRHKAYKDMADFTTKGIINYFYPSL